MAIVRLLFALALGAIVISLVIWVIKRDPQYLRFVFWVAKLTLAAALAVLLWFAADRLWFNPLSIEAGTPEPVFVPRR